MLQVNITDRYSASEVLEHPWFQLTSSSSISQVELSVGSTTRVLSPNKIESARSVSKKKSASTTTTTKPKNIPSYTSSVSSSSTMLSPSIQLFYSTSTSSKKTVSTAPRFSSSTSVSASTTPTSSSGRRFWFWSNTNQTKAHHSKKEQERLKHIVDFGPPKNGIEQISCRHSTLSTMTPSISTIISDQCNSQQRRVNRSISPAINALPLIEEDEVSLYCEGSLCDI
jgi:hypothetical protein